MNIEAKYSRRAKFKKLIQDHAVNKATVEKGNARWWPKYTGALMYLRPWMSSVHQIDGLFFNERQVFTKNQCADIKNHLLSLQKFWTAYPEEQVNRLGTPTCTLRGVDNTVIAKSNELLLKEFPDLYPILLQELETVLDTKNICYKNNSYLPGFNIVDNSNLGGTNNAAKWLSDLLRSWFYSIIPVAPFHTDGQYNLLEFGSDIRECPKISFTLPIDLPESGSGLYIFNATDRTSSRKAILSKKCLVKYEIGKMVIHDGDHWHLIAPMNFKLNEYRIMIQGHGVKYRDTWHVYW